MGTRRLRTRLRTTHRHPQPRRGHHREQPRRRPRDGHSQPMERRHPPRRRGNPHVTHPGRHRLLEAQRAGNGHPPSRDRHLPSSDRQRPRQSLRIRPGRMVRGRPLRRRDRYEHHAIRRWRTHGRIPVRTRRPGSHAGVSHLPRHARHAHATDRRIPRQRRRSGQPARIRHRMGAARRIPAPALLRYRPRGDLSRPQAGRQARHLGHHLRGEHGTVSHGAGNRQP